MLEQKVLKPPLYERVIDCRWMAKNLLFNSSSLNTGQRKSKKCLVFFHRKGPNCLVKLKLILERRSATCLPSTAAQWPNSL